VVVGFERAVQSGVWSGVCGNTTFGRICFVILFSDSDLRVPDWVSLSHHSLASSICEEMEEAIHTGLSILLSVRALFRPCARIFVTSKRIRSSRVSLTPGDYDTLADLLEHFLNRLDIYTKIPSTTRYV